MGLQRCRPLEQGLEPTGCAAVDFAEKKGMTMKQTEKKPVPQPKPFTPGITKGMVRQHAFTLYRDKLAHDKLTLEDWVLAEKDLVGTLEADMDS